MQVFINDKSFECAPGVDFNVIPRPDWGKTVLQDGSKIIIIKAVQGG